MFVDWQCPDSAKSWAVMSKVNTYRSGPSNRSPSQVLDHFGDKIHFVFSVTHLWFFRQSSNLIIAAEVIAGNTQPEGARLAISLLIKI